MSVSSLFEGETGVYMIRLNNLKNADEIESYSAFENQLTNKRRTNLDFNIVQSLKSQLKFLIIGAILLKKFSL